MSNVIKRDDAMQNFKLLDYVAADLRRAQELTRGHKTQDLSLRLWLGIFSPRFLPVFLCRISYFFYHHRMIALAKIISLINFCVFGIEIAVRCPIGKGLFFPHTQGTVIGAISIGENATIFQGVTLGALEADFSYQSSMRPVVEDGVIIGAGAKVLGGIKLGHYSRVGANAVVLDDVPPEALAVGVPARIVIK